MCLFIGGDARGGWSCPGQPPARPHRRARRSPGCRFARIGTKRSSCRIRCKDKEDSYEDREDTYQIKPNASIRQVFCSEVAEGVAHARQAGERDRRAGWPQRAARLWKLTPETAERLRGRIKNVLDAAKPKGCRTGENPARLRRGTGRCHPWRWRCCCAG